VWSKVPPSKKVLPLALSIDNLGLRGKGISVWQKKNWESKPFGKESETCGVFSKSIRFKCKWLSMVMWTWP
jgi:hypothetical protein